MGSVVFLHAHGGFAFSRFLSRLSPMISRLGLAVAAVFRKVAPDPFVLAILLTVVAIVFALARTDSSMGDLVGFWADDSDGVWKLLKFGMQMCLILVTGHALASSPPMSALLNRIAGLPRTGWQAAALVAFVAACLGVLNWGLGLIAGALLARRVGVAMHKRGVAVHYPLLCAAGYVGLLVWHGGFSGSAPTKVTTENDIEEIIGPGVIEVLPLTETILSPMNLFVTIGLLLIAPALMAFMSPTNANAIQTADRFIDINLDDAVPETSERADKPLIPRILEDTPLLSLTLVALIGWWAWTYYSPAAPASSQIDKLTPNTVNLTMLMLGLLLHGTPARYVRAVDEAVRGCGGIILQFPLYAGIMGVMQSSGLTAQFASQMAETANETTLPLVTFISAALVNLFVPSGGGQWAIQGPIAMEAAVSAGVEPGKMVMAFAYGDELTNMLQPFWALPLLAITGMKAREIVGYTAIVMIVAGAWMTLGLLIF